MEERLTGAQPADRAAHDAVAGTILETVAAEAARRPLPSATYRVQFNAAFTFQDARAQVKYWSDLGISHLYASPYLQARAGSPHGYDIVNHAELNLEIGSAADFDDLVRALHAHGLEQILDVVPNHMGVATNDNAWWLDVLENGPSSPYAAFFDIDWVPLKPDLANKVLLPVLGDQFGKVLEEGLLKLSVEDGAFLLNYYDRRFPIAPRPAAAILKHRIDMLKERLGTEHPSLIEYQSILTAIGHLPPRDEMDPERIQERRREKEVIKRRLNDLVKADPEIQRFLHENLCLFNGTPGDPRSFDLLDQLLQEQAYRLAYWRVAADEINYRRFFDINELAAICMENPDVFRTAHGLILRLVEEGKIDGLRIDHPDGLFDPPAYLLQLQQARFQQLCRRAAEQLGHASDGGAWQALEAACLERWAAERAAHPESAACRPLYIVVEKILGRGERLPDQWPVHGTTGYEFLNTLNGVFVDRAAARTFDAIYARFIRSHLDFRDLAYQCKKQIMLVSMSSEIEVLAHQLDRISEQNRWSRDFTLNTLRIAIREVIACFPVYRTYITDAAVDERDRQYVEHAVARAKRKNPATSASIFDFVRDALLLHYPEGCDEVAREARRRFVGKYQQVTGPVMAKGLEDTAFYIFNRLASLNEVGGEPDKFGNAVATFHQRNLERQTRWPHALLPTTTHDTKRSEDVRARINILSELSADWRSHLARWGRLNQRRKTEVDGEPAPSRNDEYLLYQSLIGTWPFQPTHDDGHAEPAEPASTPNRHDAPAPAPAKYVERIQQYMLKAAREAKVHTSWINPHDPYERATHAFVAAILADTRRNGFLNSLVPFAGRVAQYGIWNSLAQTLLRLASPGVPDIYQGTELWDLTLVDPDNRLPVDYDTRARMLQALRQRQSESARGDLARELLESRYDGRIKMFLVSVLLNYRRANPQLFTTGTYLPLDADGSRKEHVCAFLRRSRNRAVVAAAPRLTVRLTEQPSQPPIGPDVWSDTWLLLPPDVPAAALRSIFTGEVVQVTDQPGGRGVRLADLLRTFPVALFEAE